MPGRMAGKKDSSSPPPPTPDASSATRLQRNLAEKQRRDKLNGYISELATIVPMVSMASKRLDKTSILRLSAAHLRICQSFLSGSRKKTKKSFKWRPSFFTNEQMREILECVDGFLLVTTSNGKIMYVSSSVERFLGHQNLEMIGHSIFSFVHPSDSDMVHEQLQTLTAAVDHNNGNSNSSTRCSFYCRLRERSQPRSEVLTYQFVHVVGHMTASSDDSDSGPEDGRPSRAASSASLNPILKAFVRVVHSNPYNELSLTDMIEDEYVTRHAPDGTIVFADHRLSTITGHLPHEVYGMSAYEYIVKEDVPVALFAHKLMFTNESGTGMIVYRLRMRNEGCVYLKTTGYLQFVKSAARVDHFVCVNKQLNEEEGEKELKKFIERFTPHIQGTCPSILYETIKSMQCSPAGESKVKTDCSDSDSSAVQMDTNCIAANSNCTEMEMDGKSVQSSQLKSAHVGLDPVIGGCSKQLYDKISLETEASGPALSNYSPLTESSLSANSPQSEDTCTPSPLSSGIDHMDVAYSHDSSSSSELPSNLARRQSGDSAASSSLPCSVTDSSAMEVVGSTFSAEPKIGVFIQSSNSIASPVASTAVNVSVMPQTFWSSSSKGGGYSSEVLPTPPPSSADENADSHSTGC